MADEEFLRVESVLRELISEMEKFRSAHASLEMAGAHVGSLILNIQNLCSKAGGLFDLVGKSTPAVSRSAEMLTEHAKGINDKMELFQGLLTREFSSLREEQSHLATSLGLQVPQLVSKVHDLEQILINLQTAMTRADNEKSSILTKSIAPIVSEFNGIKAGHRDLREKIQALERAQSSLQESLGLTGNRLLARSSKILGLLVAAIAIESIAAIVTILH